MIELKNICYKFGRLPILEDINLSIKKGEKVALIGRSGCGKSTLLELVAGLKSPIEGDISFNGDRISYAFQDDRLLNWKSVWNNISLVRERQDSCKIRKLLEEVGLVGFEDYKPLELSGGMKKRLALARAFYYQADLVLMDEPFTGLDYYARLDMIKVLLEVWEKDRPAILFVTHELYEAMEVADRIVVLSGRPAKIVDEFTLEGKYREDERDRIRQKILSAIKK